MAKKQRQNNATTAAPVNATQKPEATFPELSVKDELERTIILEDQIILIHDLFSAEECKRFIKTIDALPLELTPPKKRGEAERVNHRFSVTSPSFAERLHAIIRPHLPETFPYPMSTKRPPATASRLPHSLNSNIRVYKYTEGQYFGPHYDDSVRDPTTGAKSEWTLLIYISGAEDGVRGGETLFYQEQRGRPRETITPPLARGTALLHRHGNECLLHEGSPVTQGTKYVLRSDLMFM